MDFKGLFKITMKLIRKIFKKNKKDIVCPYINLTPYKEQRKCKHFEQASDDDKNQFECTHCLIGRSSSLLCELKMTQKQIKYFE